MNKRLILSLPLGMALLLALILCSLVEALFSNLRLLATGAMDALETLLHELGQWEQEGR